MFRFYVKPSSGGQNYPHDGLRKTETYVGVNWYILKWQWSAFVGFFNF
jgi:hypothetical protein